MFLKLSKLFNQIWNTLHNIVLTCRFAWLGFIRIVRIIIILSLTVVIIRILAIFFSRTIRISIVITSIIIIVFISWAFTLCMLFLLFCTTTFCRFIATWYYNWCGSCWSDLMDLNWFSFYSNLSSYAFAYLYSLRKIKSIKKLQLNTFDYLECCRHVSFQPWPVCQHLHTLQYLHQECSLLIQKQLQRLLLFD
jgi:hypothetical protein